MGTGPGGVLAVDTAELDELCERLRRTADAVQDAGRGVHALAGLGGLAVGADAVLDALSDLVRQWGATASVLGDDAVGLGLAVQQARTAYESCEGRVSGLVCVRGPAGDAS
ncbi:hypothetical protein [Aquipuribacter sp. MA13-6]|uniref:hypothetical protein n=1 Tax=unclassified Aquipuribacter TaxID=2635084 RepID=UPI003EEEBB1D